MRELYKDLLQKIPVGMVEISCGIIRDCEICTMHMRVRGESYTLIALSTFELLYAIRKCHPDMYSQTSPVLKNPEERLNATIIALNPQASRSKKPMTSNNHCHHHHRIPCLLTHSWPGYLHNHMPDLACSLNSSKLVTCRSRAFFPALRASLVSHSCSSREISASQRVFWPRA